MAPLTLAVATTISLRMSLNRKKQSSEHPIFKKFNLEVIPYQHPEIENWRNNFIGVRYLDEATNLEVFGAVDDVWEDINSKDISLTTSPRRNRVTQISRAVGVLGISDRSPMAIP